MLGWEKVVCMCGVSADNDKSWDKMLFDPISIFNILCSIDGK